MHYAFTDEKVFRYKVSRMKNENQNGIKNYEDREGKERESTKMIKSYLWTP